MRISLVLNRELVEEAMRLTGARTQREAIEMALRTLIEIKGAERRDQVLRQRAEGIDARLSRLELARRPTDLLREDRDRS